MSEAYMFVCYTNRCFVSKFIQVVRHRIQNSSVPQILSSVIRSVSIWTAITDFTLGLDFLDTVVCFLVSSFKYLLISVTNARLS